MIIAQPNDKDRAVEILTYAFDQNASVNFIVKQDELRLIRIKKLMEYAFEVCYRFGKVVLSDDRKACALLLYPDLKKMTIELVSHDLKLIIWSIGVCNVVKAIKREAKIKAVQPRVRMAYIWFIGVEPKYQKFGLGKKLMNEVIIACQQENRPIYLETSTLANLPWYKKFGFEVYDMLELGYQLYFLRLPFSN
ncbi:GNAT family N-acetyltransferase [Pedobacter sp. Du54]|uniref:GNAT family N-acetyltransferase n=1 Tax=Pedobacter anseongensis TaxID=3133439 RepID=UPI0030A803A4